MPSAADPWLQDIIETRATLSTITNIHQLLHGVSTEPAQKAGKENGRVKKSRVLATANVGAKAKNIGRPKVRGATAEPIAVQAESPNPLNAQEKLVLATETVNATLKSLSQALKAQSRPKSPIKNAASPENAQNPSTQPSRTSSSKSERALKPRSSNVGNRPAPPQKSADAGPGDSIRATAECARIAFAYLRAHQKEQSGSTPDFQLENGMLALVGKCVAHGLEEIALKELRVLKARLDDYIGRNLVNGEQKEQAHRKADQEKEIMAGLLQFQGLHEDDPIVPVVVNHQLYVLKIMLAQMKPRSIEAALDHLKLSAFYSPINLLILQAKSPELKSKSARQLESLAQTLFSLCANVTSTDDPPASNLRLHVNTDVALQLQTLALRSRLFWWRIAGHQPNVDKELWAPFSKCIAAYSRRAGSEAIQNYDRAKSCLSQLKTALKECMSCSKTPVDEDDLPSLKMTYRSLSQLAQAANLTAEAMEWTTALPLGLPDTSTTETASRTIRLAALGLNGKNGAGLVEAAIKSLHGSLTGDSSILDNVLVEVSGFRKSALKAFVEEVKQKERGPGELSPLGKLCSEAIFSSLRFLIRYLGQSPPSTSDSYTIKRYHDRVVLTQKVAKAFVDSVIICSKSRIQLGDIEFEKTDAVLRDCFLLVTELQGADEGGGNAYEFHKELQFPLVAISNLYYVLYQHQSRVAGASRTAGLTPLRRSIEVLRGRTAVEKDGGQFSVKLDRLAEVYYNSGHPKEARNSINESIREHVEAGHLRTAAEASTTRSLLELADGKSSVSLLVRVLKQNEHIAIKYSSMEDSASGVFNDQDLLPEERGLLLEWQLEFASQTVQRSRNMEAGLVQRCRTLVGLLLEIYNSNEYPIRRLRVATTISRLIAEHPLIIDEPAVDDAEACLQIPRRTLGKDTGLQRYRTNLLAMLRAAKALRSFPVEISDLESSLVEWQVILDSCTSTETLLSNIDDIDAWVAQVSMITDYLEMQGIHRLLIPTLHLLSKVFELKPERDYSKFLQTQSKLALLHLKLGYSGKAGLMLAKAEPPFEQPDVSTEAIIQWHLTYAEYLLEIGNIEQCGEILRKAEKYATSSSEFLQMSGPTATSSSRIKLSRLLADASHIYARYHLDSGSADEAFRFARNCVRLNQRVWMTLESRISATPSPTPGSTDTEMESTNISMSSFSAGFGFGFGRTPVVSSMTHDSLSGPAFWSLVPALYRSLSHLSSVFGRHGMITEAVHYAEQAKRVARAVSSPICTVEASTQLADLRVREGNIEAAQNEMDEITEFTKEFQDCSQLVDYKVLAAKISHEKEEVVDGINYQDEALAAIDRLTAPEFLTGFQKVKTGQDQLADTLAGLSLEPKPPKAARGRKAAAPKVAAKTKSVRKVAPIKSNPATPNTIEDCASLLRLRKHVFTLKALALLKDKQDHAAAVVFEQAQQIKYHHSVVSDSILASRLLFVEMAKQLASNLTFSALLESTIALPALAQSERRSSFGAEPTAIIVQSRKTPAKTAKKTATRKAPAKRATIVENFAAPLQKARDGLVQAHGLALRTSSTSTIQEFFQLLGSNSVLLSAAAHIHPKAHINALPAAFFLDAAKIRISQMEQAITKAENEAASKEKLFQWPCTEVRPSEAEELAASQFQADYIDILPTSWTAISMSLNDTKDELLLTRYRAGQSPFILRLALTRHSSRDLDEEDFDFHAGKKEMLDIIELANFSAHDARHMNVKGAKTQWWAEREAVDKRLGDLLVNIENIWLGGFRGMFAQNQRNSHALSAFQKDLQNSLNRHLPSRRGKGVRKPMAFDTRILELFIGIGDPDEEDVDVDGPLEDLVYFIIDILQFNGEENAVDEVDTDSIVVEMVDALKNYYSAVGSEKLTGQHTILILDNHLHAFPWESLPSLRQQSISRLSSLAQLRQRLLAMDSTNDQSSDTSSSSSEDTPDGYYISKSSGASILNPSGDLTNTQRTLQPLLYTLPSTWTHTTTPAPNESSMSALLSTHELLLYFGHGSGAQYIRPRAVKKLANKATSAPTTWLMGCSSVAVTECGEFEPHGMVCAYLSAGAPAVVGTLWDVTDKDCDRAAVKAGAAWGLWDAPPPEAKNVKSKGKQKDVEVIRCGKVAEKRRVFENGSGDVSEAERSRSRSTGPKKGGVSLVEAVTKGRDATYLRYLNGAALVVYGVPVYLKE